MSILKVARMGHPVLRARARALDRTEVKSASIQKLIDDMLETMAEYHGVGLAAPQVHEGLRVFVAALDTGEKEGESEPVAIINPEITPVGGEGTQLLLDLLGCARIQLPPLAHMWRVVPALTFDTGHHRRRQPPLHQQIDRVGT